MRTQNEIKQNCVKNEFWSDFVSKGNRDDTEDLKEKCNKKEIHYYKDITNKQFGKLTAIKYEYTKNKKPYWLCRCECGKNKIIAYSSLKSGATKSCGCLKHETSINHYSNLNKTHGMKNTKIYQKWLGMKARCYNSKTKGYKNYGDRGITVCDEWKNDFLNFYNWAINNGYKDGLTLERIDVNGNYEPINCKWITNLEQQNNKRNNKFIEYKNEKHTIAEWSRITGINKNTLLTRLNSHWDIEEVIGIKNHKKGSVENV